MPNKIDFEQIDFEPIDFDPVKPDPELLSKHQANLAAQNLQMTPKGVEPNLEAIGEQRREGFVDAAKGFFPGMLDLGKKAIFGQAIPIAQALSHMGEAEGRAIATYQGASSPENERELGSTVGGQVIGTAIGMAAPKLIGSAARYMNERRMLAPSTATNNIVAAYNIKSGKDVAIVRRVMEPLHKYSKLTETPIKTTAELEKGLYGFRDTVFANIEPIYNSIADDLLTVGRKVRDALNSDINPIEAEQFPSLGKRVSRLAGPYEKGPIKAEVIVDKIKKNNVRVKNLQEARMSKAALTDTSKLESALETESNALREVLNSHIERKGVPIENFKELNRTYGDTKDFLNIVKAENYSIVAAKARAAGMRFPGITKGLAGAKHIVNPLSARMTPFRAIGSAITKMQTPDHLVEHAFNLMNRIDVEGGALFPGGMAAQNFPVGMGHPQRLALPKRAGPSSFGPTPMSQTQTRYPGIPLGSSPEESLGKAFSNVAAESQGDPLQLTTGTGTRELPGQALMRTAKPENPIVVKFEDVLHAIRIGKMDPQVISDLVRRGALVIQGGP